MKFYRIDWPAPEQAQVWTDWSTSWDEAHRIGRARSDYYSVTQVEVPDKKAELLAFLKTHIKRAPAEVVVGLGDGFSRSI
ncbi:MAG TPA: hypothetical protein VFN88_01800 [Caulobacteraceae bacterium]|nr:hypothetical protein [Caulobacteraceae bacterium]